MLELILIRQEAGRPFAAPPGVPADRLAALRRAFDATLKDAGFRADADKAQLEIEPLTAGEIETASWPTAYGAPKTIVQKAAALVEPSSRAQYRRMADAVRLFERARRATGQIAAALPVEMFGNRDDVEVNERVTQYRGAAGGDCAEET